MVNVLPRSAWTDTPFGWDRTPLNVTNPQGIACHWPTGKTTPLTQAAVAATLRSIRNYHVNVRGWSDIGYNYGVDMEGRLWTLAGERQAAHAASEINKNANAKLYGVLFIVNETDGITEAAKTAFRRLRHEKLGATLPVMGHQDVYGAQTECPGGNIMGVIRAGQLTSGYYPTPTEEIDMAAREDILAAIERSHDGHTTILRRLDATLAELVSTIGALAETIRVSDERHHKGTTTILRRLDAKHPATPD